MQGDVSIVMPAFRAQATIADAVQSVLAQTHTQWELIVVADDEADYRAILAARGLDDPRIRYLATGRTGSGSPPARNIGLDAARYRFSAILDADDRFHPEKLQRAVAVLSDYGIVSTALTVTDPDHRPLRHVAAGEDRELPAAGYKFVNFSMDSMLVYDRSRADPRFDPGLPCLTDLDFLLKLFAGNRSCFHLGTPLHDYVKQPLSVSNKPGASARMAATKRLMLERLEAGFYSMAAPDAASGFRRFLEISLDAEQAYDAARAANPDLLFEDHLEPRLATANVGP